MLLDRHVELRTPKLVRAPSKETASKTSKGRLRPASPLNFVLFLPVVSLPDGNPNVPVDPLNNSATKLSGCETVTWSLPSAKGMDRTVKRLESREATFRKGKSKCLK